MGHPEGQYRALPRTTKVSRMQESLDIFDFALSDEDMERIDELKSIGGYEFDPDTAQS